MPDYVVVYNDTDGSVLKIFERTTSDNVSTWKADGKLTVDGVDVILGLSGMTSEFVAVLVEDAASFDAAAPPGVYLVDDFEVPTTMEERTDDARDQDYPYSEP